MFASLEQPFVLHGVLRQHRGTRDQTDARTLTIRVKSNYLTLLAAAASGGVPGTRACFVFFAFQLLFLCFVRREHGMRHNSFFLLAGKVVFCLSCLCGLCAGGSPLERDGYGGGVRSVSLAGGDLVGTAVRVGPGSHRTGFGRG